MNHQHNPFMLRKLLIVLLFSTLIISGFVSAASPETTIQLIRGKEQITSTPINGSLHGVGTAIGYLNTEASGSARMQVKKMTTLYPDTPLLDVAITSMTPMTYTITNMYETEQLYYMQIDLIDSNQPANATGSLRNY